MPHAIKVAQFSSNPGRPKQLLRVFVALCGPLFAAGERKLCAGGGNSLFLLIHTSLFNDFECRYF